MNGGGASSISTVRGKSPMLLTSTMGSLSIILVSSPPSSNSDSSISLASGPELKDTGLMSRPDRGKVTADESPRQNLKVIGRSFCCSGEERKLSWQTWCGTVVHSWVGSRLGESRVSSRQTSLGLRSQVSSGTSTRVGTTWNQMQKSWLYS